MRFLSSNISHVHAFVTSPLRVCAGVKSAEKFIGMVAASEAVSSEAAAPVAVAEPAAAVRQAMREGG